MPKGKFLAEFEMYLMLALEHLKSEAYGVAIRKLIETRAGRPVSIGAVYATLARLETKGMVRHEVSQPLPIPGGKSRKFFELTGEGQRALRHSTGMLGKMMHGLEYGK